jgi:tetratricopeptide (TPR) repeat protein
LDGLPLSIELAAARIKILSPASVAAKLDHRLDILTGGSRDVPSRQQSLRNTIEWSYRLLQPAEQQLFRRLAVFSGGCTLESIEAVCNTRRDIEMDIDDGIKSLLDNSLLQIVGNYEGESRFVMLETLREYALERLAESGDYELTRRAHAAYCLVLAEEGNVARNVGEEEEWLARCSVEHENLRSAIDWLVESGNADWALRAGIALFTFWERRDHFAEGLQRLTSILQLSHGIAHMAQRAMAASCAGALAADLGDWQTCQTLLDVSLRDYRAAGDRHGIAAQLNRIGVNLGFEGKYEQAAVMLEQSVLAWEDAGEPLIAAGVSCALADVLSVAGEHVRARDLLEAALRNFRSSGDMLGAARALSYLGDAARNRGDSEAARREYEESLSGFRAANDRAGVARCHVDLGFLHCDAAVLPEAVSHLREALHIFTDLAQRRGVARALDGFVRVASLQGRFEQALTLGAAADAIRRSARARLRPREEAAVHDTLARARKHVGSALGADAWQAGCHMNLREAVEYAINLAAHAPA